MRFYWGFWRFYNFWDDMHLTHCNIMTYINKDFPENSLTSNWRFPRLKGEFSQVERVCLSILLSMLTRCFGQRADSGG